MGTIDGCPIGKAPGALPAGRKPPSGRDSPSAPMHVAAERRSFSCPNKRPAGMRNRLPAMRLPAWMLRAILLLLISYMARGQDAADAGVQRETSLREIQGRLSSLSDSSAPGLKETAVLAVSDTPLSEFLRGLAQTHRLNVSVDPRLNQRISNNFTGVKVSDLILFLCREHGVDVRFTGSILAFVPHAPPAPPRAEAAPREIRLSYDTDGDLLTADLAADSLAAFTRKLTRISKRNVVLAPGLDGRLLTGYVENMPFESGLDKIAFANGLRLHKTADNVFLIDGAEGTAVARMRAMPVAASASNAPATGLYIEAVAGGGDRLLNVDVSNAPIADIINEASGRLGLNYVLFSALPGTTTIHIQKIRYEDLLALLLQGTSHTVRMSDGVYLIGDRNAEGFRNTQLVKLQFRPAEKIDEVIPPELRKGVDIKVFKELNGLIVSGGLPQIQEVAAFLKAIDQPVPNVLIEVMVVEMSKSHSVETGIRAFLSDTARTTGGQVFPGLNLTVGAGGINRFLQDLAGRGIANIGRVTPNFYVTLKALEQNNYIHVRSTPKLSTLNGHEANLVIGQSVYYLEQTQNITGGVTPINSVSQQFRRVEANLVIKINPMVSGDEHITLDISAEFSDFIPPVINGAPPGNATRKFTSMIRIKNEEMIILGGLEEAKRTSGGSGVPVLSRIPLLKWLFSSRRREKSDKHLLVFIKPTLVY